MALANFYSRAEQSLSQVLQSVDSDKLRDILEKRLIGVAFDDKSLDSRNSEIILELVINLIARLYPKLGIIYSGDKDEGKKIVKRLTSIALLINPDIDLIDNADRFTAVLCLGKPECKSERNIYLGANSWNLEVSIDKPTDILEGDTLNPFSASAVACFGLSELFRIVFSDVLIDSLEPQSLTLSLLDYSRGSVNLKELTPVYFKDLTFVGLGAVGNAAVWCLKWLPSLGGRINFVDHENIELSNLQRYVLSHQQNVNLSKVDIAKSYLMRDNLDIQKFPIPFGQYVKEYRPKCDFDIIAVSVDNAQNRVAAQAVLPRIVLNAWTGDSGYLGVSRHVFDHPEKACLACMYLSTSKSKSKVGRIAEIIGVEQEKTRYLVVNKTPLTSELLKEINRKKGYSLETLMRFSGKTLDDFYTEAICGGIILPLGNNADTEDAVVPLVHQSVLAGVLLGCEIVKETLGIVPKDYKVETRLSVLAKLPDYLCTNRGKTIDPKCICSDNDYLDVYLKKHNTF